MLGRNHQGLVSNVLKDSLTNEVVKRFGEPERWLRIRFSSLPQTGGAFTDVDVTGALCDWEGVCWMIEKIKDITVADSNSQW